MKKKKKQIGKPVNLQKAKKFILGGVPKKHVGRTGNNYKR